MNVYVPERTGTLAADWIVMATGRRSENGLYHALGERGTRVEMIGDAVAPADVRGRLRGAPRRSQALRTMRRRVTAHRRLLAL